jgi:hypothetical protein
MSLLRTAAQFDVFGHAGALFQALTRGPATQFNVYPGVADYEVAGILRRNGIDYWSMIRMSNELLAFRVSPGQGRHCGQVLTQNGIAHVADWSGAGKVARRRPQRRRRGIVAMLRRAW